MVVPSFLQKGDRVAVLAPSSPQPQEHIEKAIQSIENIGLIPVVYPNCQLAHGFLAGTDKQRAQDINDAFADDSIKGIICIRGGYGAHRLMHLLDWDKIAQNAKPLFGYSDITALHMQLNQYCHMVGWHTPMPGTEWYKGLDEYTEEYLQRALFGPLTGTLCNPQDMPMQTLQTGTATGQLIGGNLSLIASTMGTPYELDTKDKILFIEEVDEEPYTVDRMLLELKHNGKLADCAGILVGAFTNCEKPRTEKPFLPLEQVFAELLFDEGKPILAGVQCGHVLPTMSLPLGAMVAMNADAKTIEVVGV